MSMETVVTDAPQAPGEACVGVAEHRMDEAKLTDDNDLLCLEVTTIPRVRSRVRSRAHKFAYSWWGSLGSLTRVHTLHVESGGWQLRSKGAAPQPKTDGRTGRLVPPVLREHALATLPGRGPAHPHRRHDRTLASSSLLMLLSCLPKSRPPSPVRTSCHACTRVRLDCGRPVSSVVLLASIASV